MNDDESAVNVTLREWLAIRLIGLASWALPDGHHALLSCHNLAAEIEHPPTCE